MFEVGDGRVEVYPGNYEDYLWRKQGGAEALQEAVAVSRARARPANGDQALPPRRRRARRLNPIKRKQMEERVHELEAEIGQLETTIADLRSVHFRPSSAPKKPSGLRRNWA